MGLARECAVYNTTNISRQMSRIRKKVEASQSLLGYSNFHSYYSAVVHQDACGTTLVGIGWLVFFQSVICLLFLPCNVIFARQYLQAVDMSCREQEELRESLRSAVDMVRVAPSA